VRSLLDDLGRMHVVPRWTARGMVTLAVLGAIGGLIIGLANYPQTAWFALFEGAALAGVAGGLAGFVLGMLAWLAEQASHRRA
jgi:hypothetical protein